MAYRTSGEARDLAIDPEEILRAQRRALRRRLVAIAVAVVLIGAAATAFVLAIESRGREAARMAYGQLDACLFGDRGEEKPSARVRNLQLKAMSTPPDKRLAAEASDAWPLRCSAPAHRFAEALRQTGKKPELSAAAEKLGKALASDAAYSADLSALVDDLHARAAAEAFDRGDQGGDDLTRTPPAATPMTLATLPEDARLVAPQTTLSGVHVSPFADHVLRLVVDERDLPTGPVACAMARADEALICTRIPRPASQLTPALRPWGTTAEKTRPFVFAGDRGKAGVFDAAKGTRVVEKLEYGAYGASALEDGSLAYLVWNDRPPGTHLVRIAPDGARSETRIVARSESGNPYYSTSILWDFVAYKQVRKDSDGIRLMVRELGPAGGAGPPVDIGRIDEVGHIEGGSEEAHLTGCRNGRTVAIRAKGWQNTYLSFRSPLFAGGWSAPVESRGLRGALTCGEVDEATVTRVRGRRSGSRFKGAIEQSVCNASGCSEKSVDVGAMLAHAEDVMPREEKDIRAIDLGGRLLIIWSAGDAGGIRMRLAPIDRIAGEQDSVIFDDRVRDGVYTTESTVIGFELLPGARGAVLLLGTVDGVYAFSIDPQRAEKVPAPLPTRLSAL
jgi:hypothetical protein